MEGAWGFRERESIRVTAAGDDNSLREPDRDEKDPSPLPSLTRGRIAGGLPFKGLARYTPIVFQMKELNNRTTLAVSYSCYCCVSMYRISNK